MYVLNVSYEDEMQKSYIDYAMSVIVQRALPDVRDGLKPVHRRILYAMQELNLHPDKIYRKSARIVGDTMGKYHPHGDSSIYEAMVKMSQDFYLNFPLVNGHGNFGSIDGDKPASMRYTEAKLKDVAIELLSDMDKEIVDFKSNFDGTLKEPVILPARFPNLLVNGSTGIAVGMKTDIPPHNLEEVIDAVIALLKNKNLSNKDLNKIVKGPDFPTGGIITNKQDLEQIYETGTGRIKIRGVVKTEGKNIVITEIPYTLSGNKQKLLDEIIGLINDKKIDEISDVWDESDKDGIRVVLQTKKNADIQRLINKLYKLTSLEDGLSVNMLAIVDGIPTVLSLKDALTHFIDFQKELNTKKYRYLLEKSMGKKEIVEGLITAHGLIDLIIDIIRNSDKVEDVKRCLMFGDVKNIKFKTKKSEKIATSLSFTENQTNAILSLQLQRLVKLEIEKLEKELKDLNNNINKYINILSVEEKLKKVIIKDLSDIKNKFNRPRKTKITNQVFLVDEKEEVVTLGVLIDNDNYIKTVDAGNISRYNKENYKNIFEIQSDDKVVLFTSQGTMYQLKAKDIHSSKKGVLIDAIIEPNETVIFTCKYAEMENKELILMTEQGHSKKISELSSNRQKLSIIKLKEDDLLHFVGIINEDDDLIVQTFDDFAFRTRLADLPLLQRQSQGVKTIKIAKGDAIKIMLLCKEKEFKNIKYSKRWTKGTKI